MKGIIYIAERNISHLGVIVIEALKNNILYIYIWKWLKNLDLWDNLKWSDIEFQKERLGQGETETFENIMVKNFQSWKISSMNLN